ncbi:LysR family transcriptional regulator ArgP [Chitinilyticum piscinae]|uniref:LysR family transcriptional regulator ArgP n=1 Tax=Chitinilyticum piscinae TaxID=2866724 RepID=A0A8J7FH27_9NEIS|nr:LysR family transcriptional regulator ArgP [Chitinilyticum piscinae]MBE9609318.1 LysR family transcriptional regulator ArgP [Chitinilyticum piscinae]
MLDYKLLEALDAVVTAGSFDGAARRLHLTQSAISQRIRQLEERSGTVLLVRDTPVRPTVAGQKLLAHVRQVRLLEAELQQDVDGTMEDWLTLRIGVNADSLALGLLGALAPVLQAERILLDCVVADEAQTLDQLRLGEVSGCIGTQPNEIAGCGVIPLGSIDYVLVATPAFAAEFFSGGLGEAALSDAPAAVFGQQDSIHRRWLREQHGLQHGDYPCHVIPDSTALFGAVCAGLAYGLVPRPQADALLNAGALQQLPLPAMPVALYWHHWRRQTAAERKLAEAVRGFTTGLCG